MNQALDMWFGKIAQAAKEAQKVTQVEETDPLKRAIKKPMTKKGLNGQGFKGRGRNNYFR